MIQYSVLQRQSKPLLFLGLLRELCCPTNGRQIVWQAWLAELETKKTHNYGGGKAQKGTWTNRRLDNERSRQIVWEGTRRKNEEFSNNGREKYSWIRRVRVREGVSLWSSCHRCPRFPLQICGQRPNVNANVADVREGRPVSCQLCRCWMTLLVGVGSQFSGRQWCN